jgi:hypothetical protein
MDAALCCVCHLPVGLDSTEVVNTRSSGKGYDGRFVKGAVWHPQCGALDMPFDADGNPVQEAVTP